MAPEQFEGIASIATDQYALACVLFESLTGRLPASSAFSAVPFGLRNTLRKALSPVPAQRFGSVEEFAHSLERVQRLRRRRIPLLAAVCIAGLVVALAGHYLYSTIRQRRAEREVANTLAGFRMATNAIQNAGYAGSTDPQQSVYLLLQLRRFADIAQPNADSLHTIVAALAEAGMILGHPGRRHAGQTEQALQLLREAVRYADRRSLLAPSHFSAHSAAETRYALSSILIEMDRFQEARAVIVEALRILPVAAHTPSLLQPVQAGLIGNLSRIAFGTRDFPTCLVLRNQYVLMRAAIAGILPDPSNTHALSGAYQARGYLLREMGRHAEAVSDYTRSDEILRGLLTADPDNTQFHWQLARNALEIGRTYSSAGRHRLALPFLESAVGSLRKFIDLNQSDQHTRRELALALAWLAHARASAGASRSNWQPLFDEAIALSQAMAAADPSSAKAQSEWRHVRELAAAAGQIGSSPARPAPWR